MHIKIKQLKWTLIKPSIYTKRHNIVTVFLGTFLIPENQTNLVPRWCELRLWQGWPGTSLRSRLHGVFPLSVLPVCFGNRIKVLSKQPALQPAILCSHKLNMHRWKTHANDEYSCIRKVSDATPWLSELSGFSAVSLAMGLLVWPICIVTFCWQVHHTLPLLRCYLQSMHWICTPFFTYLY